jgi:hypothetical protein
MHYPRKRSSRQRDVRRTLLVLLLSTCLAVLAVQPATPRLGKGAIFFGPTQVLDNPILN